MLTTRRFVGSVMCLFSFVGLVSAQPGLIDPAFHRDSVFNGTVFALQTLQDGKVLVAGAFTSVTGITRNGVARVTSTGVLDLSFDPGIGIEGTAAAVYAVGVYTNGTHAGKVVIGGSFTHFDRVERRGLARLNADGSLDPSFDPGTAIEDGDVYAVAIQPDGKILVAGDFTSVRGRERNGVARFNADGGLDTNFTPGEGADDVVYGVAVQPDGKIIVAGAFTTFRGQDRPGVARLSRSGTLDSLGQFDPGTGAEDGFVYALALRTDGKIILGGDFTVFQGASRDGVALLNPDGSIDTQFAPDSGGVGGVVWAVAPAGLEAVVVAGEFTTMSNTDVPGIARLDAYGNTDLTFTNTGPEALLFNVDHGEYVLNVAVRDDGSILAGGTFELVDNFYRPGLVRILPDGAVDRIFNQESGTFDAVLASLVQPDGKLLLGGRFTLVNGESRRGLARLNADGLLDTSFAPESGAVGRVYALQLYTNGPQVGKAVIGGTLTSVDGFPVSGLARILSDGKVDTNFAPVILPARVNAVVLQPDDRILIAGAFTNVNGVPRNGIARLNVDGSLDSSFDPQGGIDGGEAYAIAIQGDNILIGGSFTGFDGESSMCLARVNQFGVVDRSFGTRPGISGGVVRVLLVQGDQSFLVGGSFTTMHNTHLGVAKFSPDGALDTSFDPGEGIGEGEVLAITAQPNGQILVGGSFTVYDGVPVGGMARLNGDGTFDFGFDTGSGATGANNTVHSLTIHPDGKVLVGGSFLAFNGAETWGLTRLLGGSAVPTPPSIVWWPAALSVLQQDSFTLNVTVAGSKPLSYQWLFEGALLPGSTNKVLRFSTVSTNQAGSYALIVANAYGSATSAPISLNVTSTVDLGLALGIPDMLWQISGDYRWYGQTEVTHEGMFASAQSGSLDDDQQTGLSTSVTGPGWLTFWWKVSSEEGYDFLQFQFNGVESEKISGEVDWVQRTVEIPTGPATLTWVYRKDGVYSAGQDAGWLSEVKYTQLPALTSATYSTNRFRLDIQAAPGQRVEIQASATLLDWTTIAVLTNATYPYSFVDETTTNYPRRFYRSFTR